MEQHKTLGHEKEIVFIPPNRERFLLKQVQFTEIERCLREGGYCFARYMTMLQCDVKGSQINGKIPDGD